MTWLRQFVRWLLACLLAATGAIGLAKRRLRCRGAIVVLAFHRILSDEQFQKTNSLSDTIMRRRTFQRLAAHVARGAEIVDLSRIAPGTPLEGLRLAFTFDDGWQDNYANAFPIVRALGIPMTIFICPGLVGQDAPFWPEQVVSSIRGARPRAVPESELEAIIQGLKYCEPEKRANTLAYLGLLADTADRIAGADQTLSWEEIAEMDQGGVTFGSHTQTHQLLTEVSESTARREVLESKAEIGSRLAKDCRLFAYPNGNHSNDTRRLLEEAGYTLAFTVQRKPWTTASDPLAIPRFVLSEGSLTGPTGRFSPALFEYSTYWKASRGDWRN